MPDSFVTPWTVACQASLSMGFPRQQYWSGLPFSSLGDLADLGIKPVSPALAGRFFTTEPSVTNDNLCYNYNYIIITVLVFPTYFHLFFYLLFLLEFLKQ